MNLQSFEIKPRFNPFIREIMAETKSGIMIGGFSPAYRLSAHDDPAESAPEEEKGVQAPAPAVPNNCHGGNCAAGCGVKPK